MSRIRMKIYLWLLRHIAEKFVQQGPHHEKRIEDYYSVLYVAARKEFPEDSGRSLRMYLIDRHGVALYSTPLKDDAPQKAK